jgi:hypothetical protein
MGKHARLATALVGAIVITVAVAWGALAAIDALDLGRPASVLAFGIASLVWALALHRLGVVLSRQTRR